MKKLIAFLAICVFALYAFQACVPKSPGPIRELFPVMEDAWYGWSNGE